MTIDPEEQKKLKPLMLTGMFLQIPKISIKPTLDGIQAAFSQVNFSAVLQPLKFMKMVNVVKFSSVTVDKLLGV